MFKTKDKKSVEIGAWVQATSGSVTIQPGKSADVPFTISIPLNKTMTSRDIRQIYQDRYAGEKVVAGKCRKAR